MSIACTDITPIKKYKLFESTYLISNPEQLPYTNLLQEIINKLCKNLTIQGRLDTETEVGLQNIVTEFGTAELQVHKDRLTNETES